jgi:hypothetical protein
MKNEYKYPTIYELKEVLSSLANQKFLESFSFKRGIFFTNANREEQAFELSNLFYEEDDIEEIRNEAYQSSATHALSGFTVKSPSYDFIDLQNSYEKVRKNGKFDEGIILNQLVNISEDGSRRVLKGSVEYHKKRTGRIEFLQEETGSFDFYLYEIDFFKWQVEVDCNKSTDCKEIKNILEKGISKSDTKFEFLDQDLLTNKQTITFFDELMQKGMSADWLIKDIKQLTLKKGNEEETSEQNLLSDDSEEVVEEEQLTGIKQAILEGKNLRENSFVRKSEESGYSFASMIYEFSHKKEPDIIQIRAEFKGRPKVFEVGIVDYAQVTDIEGHLKAVTLDSQKSRRIRSEFWNMAKDIYESLIKNGKYPNLPKAK